MKHYLKVYMLLFVLFPIIAFSQSEVSGTISDQATGLSLPGVNVIIKGTTAGTITDIDGNYTLKVSSGQILAYSYVGYVKQEVVYQGQSKLDIKLLEDASVLDEVLLVGYGSTRKEAVTGAVQKVTSEEFNKGAIVSADQLLSGKSAGVRITTGGGGPGEGAEIRIRGGSSLSANNNPLIVIDGVPLDQRGVQGVRNALNAINPSEIQEMVVLKDASATAIYGSRASNGVILITTKRTKKGAPFQIEYGFQFSVENVTDKIDVFNGDEFRTLINARSDNNPAKPLGLASTDWQNEVYRSATGGIHDITFSEGFEKFNYRVNYNNTSRQGILGNDLFRRNAITLNLGSSLLKDNLKLNLTSVGSFDDNVFANRGAIRNAIVFDPTQPIFSDGSPFDGFFEYVQPNGDPIALAPKNPVAQLEQDDNKARSKRNITNLNASYKLPFYDKVTINTNAGYDYAELDGRQFISKNSASQLNGEFRNFYSGLNRNVNLDVFLIYKNFVERFNLNYDFTAGHSYQEFYVESDQQVTEQGTLITKPTIKNRNSLEGYFGRLNLDFASKYFISASFRRDGSSRFGDANRWGNFPAVSLGWKINNEEFLVNSQTISNLKLRAGYGVTGNQEIGPNYGYLGIFTPGQASASVQFGDTFVNTLRPQAFDENLRWEETEQYNVGVDFGFLKNRINLSVDAYYRETTDLLAQVPVPAGSNLSDFLTTNVGETKSRGLEANLDVDIIRSENLKWSINVNATLQDLEITKLNLSDDANFFIPRGGISGGVGNNIQIWKPGYDPTTFFVFRQVYDQTGSPIEGAYVDVNGDNQITEADRVAYKKATPDAFIGFSSSLTYKNLDFAFTFRGSLGNYVYNNVYSDIGNYRFIEDAPGDFYFNGSTNVLETNFFNSQLFSDYYIRKADFVRLDNLSVGYTIPFEHVNFRASITGTNLFVITDYKGLDPEISSGIDNNFYPRPRGFVLGFNFIF
ncbi:MAG: SusC/RagA family TonB-linked outer membrane protein [Bacteroidetes bacterium HGW-Bacteroidetes-2]|jgi:iron complex outermembrane receptor protein|nr:MAG: SusC/RagA family TonB-linked outer membrane protein [Bacteroidetes bacterium HGW-Bacteroidetes-2]